MTFLEYQLAANETAVYPDRGDNIAYTALGLAGESGEVAEKVKKLLRDHGGVISKEFRWAVAKELGDVLWYISQVCYECELSMDAVAQDNILKLADRKDRGVLGGSGDNR